MAGFLLLENSDNLLLNETRTLHRSVSLSCDGLYIFVEEFQGLRSEKGCDLSRFQIMGMKRFGPDCRKLNEKTLNSHT